MTSSERLDGPELWSLRSTCMAEAPSYGAFITCNHEAHPDWPLPGAHRAGSAEDSTPTTAGQETRDSVGLPLADAVFAFRSFASPDPGLDDGSPIARILSSAAPSLVALGCAALVMLALTWRYRWSARATSGAGQPPYR